jgi:hypothetical protein
MAQAAENASMARDHGVVGATFLDYQDHRDEGRNRKG